MIFDRVFQEIERRSTLGNPSTDLIEALTGDGDPAVSGERVSPKKALTVSGYYAAIRAISEDVAKLPLILYRRSGKGKKRATAHPLYRVLHDFPSPECTSMVFRETIMHHALGWGNGYAEIVRKPRSFEVEGLFLIDPTTVRIEREDSGPLVYIVHPNEGGEVRLRPDQVFHIHGLGYDGASGYSVATMARETIGASIAEVKSGAALFGNSSRPGGVLEVPQKLKDGGKLLRDAWESAFRGAKNAHKTAVLEQGTTFKPIAIPNKDAQWIEARQFSVLEFCRWLRIPPHKVQDLGRATWNNIESQNIEYYADTLMPWMRRFEQEISRKLIDPREQAYYFAEHLMDAILRADTKTRYEAYAIGRQWGWLSANDVLELENRNQIGKHGDIYLVPVNMADATKINEKPEPAPAAPSPQAKELAETMKDDKDTRAQAAVLRQLIQAHRELLAAAYERLLRIEIDKLDRYSKHDDFAGWLAGFYITHQVYVAAALKPVVEAIARAAAAVFGLEGDKNVDLGAYLNQMAGRHCSKSKETDLQSAKSRKAALEAWQNGRVYQQVDFELASLEHELAKRLRIKGVG